MGTYTYTVLHTSLGEASVHLPHHSESDHCTESAGHSFVTVKKKTTSGHNILWGVFSMIQVKSNADMMTTSGTGGSYLLVVREVLHGQEGEVDNLGETCGVDFGPHLPLGEVVQTRSGCHLNPQLFGMTLHSWQNQLNKGGNSQSSYRLFFSQ